MATFHSLTVAHAHPEAQDALRIGLTVPESLRNELRFVPGQHVALRAFIDGEEVRRTYSIVSDPASPVLEIAPRILPDGRMSRHLALRAKSGTQVEVLAPSGGFHLATDPAARRTYVAFVAGCGIAALAMWIFLRNRIRHGIPEDALADFVEQIEHEQLEI